MISEQRHLKDNAILARVKAGEYIEQWATRRVHLNGSELMQVLSNLLSNAAKFSQSGQTVDISVNLEEGRVRVAERDHVIGIDDKFKARIFQRFAQADSSDSRKIQRGGTGLGLSIAKAIIEQHGGQIGYESEIGQGSCFYFILATLAE